MKIEGYKQFIQDLEPQNGKNEDIQLKAIQSLKKQFFDAQTSEVRTEIITALTRELNKSFLYVMNDREESVVVREAAWQVLADIMMTLKKDIEQAPEAPRQEKLALIMTILKQLASAGKNELFAQEKAIYRSMLRPLFELSCLLIRKHMAYQDAVNLLEGVLDIDPKSAAFRSRPGAEKVPGEDKVIMLEVLFLLYGAYTERGLDRPLDAIRFGERYVDFCKEHTDIPKELPGHLLTTEIMKKMLVLLKKPFDMDSKQILLDVFQRMVYGDRDPNNTELLMGRGKQDQRSYVIGNVSHTYTSSGDSVLGTNFGVGIMLDRNPITGSTFDRMHRFESTISYKNGTKFEESVLESGLSQKVTKQLTMKEYVRLYNSQFNFTPPEGVDRTTVRGSAGVKGVYVVDSDHRLLRNLEINGGVELFIWGKLLDPNYPAAPFVGKPGAPRYKVTGLEKFSLPASEWEVQDWTILRTNDFLTNYMPLSAGAAHRWYTHYHDQNNYSKIGVNAELSTRRPFNAGISGRWKYSPFRYLRFDAEFQAELIRRNIGAEAELGPAILYALTGGSMELGPYAGVGTKKFRSFLWGGPHALLSFLLRWTGEEFEVKAGVRGVSFGITPNRPGEFGGRLVFSWYPLGIFFVTDVNPGQITTLKDGSKGAFETARCTQVLFDDGSNISYIKKDENEYAIKITGPEEKRSGARKVANAFGELLFSATVVGPTARHIVTEIRKDKGRRKVEQQINNGVPQYIVSDTYDNGYFKRYVFEAKGKDDYQLVKVEHCTAYEGKKSPCVEEDPTLTKFSDIERSIIRRQIGALRDGVRIKELKRIIEAEGSSPLEKAQAHVDLAQIQENRSQFNKAQANLGKAHAILANESAVFNKTLTATAELPESYARILRLQAKVCHALGVIMLEGANTTSERQAGFDKLQESDTLLEKYIPMAQGRTKALLQLEQQLTRIKLLPYRNIPDTLKGQFHQELLTSITKILFILAENIDTVSKEDRTIVANGYRYLAEQKVNRLYSGTADAPSRDFKEACAFTRVALKLDPETNVFDQYTALYKYYTDLAGTCAHMYRDRFNIEIDLERTAKEDINAMSVAAEQKNAVIKQIDASIADMHFRIVGQCAEQLKMLSALKPEEGGRSAEAHQAIGQYTAGLHRSFSVASAYYQRAFEAGDYGAGEKLLDMHSKAYGVADERTQALMKKMIELGEARQEKDRLVRYHLGKIYIVQADHTKDPDVQRALLNKALTCFRKYLKTFELFTIKEYELVMKVAELEKRLGNLPEAIAELESVKDMPTEKSIEASAKLADIYAHGAVSRTELLRRVPSLAGRLDMIFKPNDTDMMIPKLSVDELKALSGFSEAEKDALASIYTQGPVARAELLRRMPSLADRLNMVFKPLESDFLVPKVTCEELKTMAGFTETEKDILGAFLEERNVISRIVNDISDRQRIVQDHGKALDLYTEACETITDTVDANPMMKISQLEKYASLARMQSKLLERMGDTRVKVPHGWLYRIIFDPKEDALEDYAKALAKIEELISLIKTKNDPYFKPLLDELNVKMKELQVKLGHDKTEKMIAEAKELIKAGKTKEAIEHLSTVVNPRKGNFSYAACVLLGDIYAQGRGVAKDIGKAEDLYTAALDHIRNKSKSIPSVQNDERVIRLLMKRASVREQDWYVFSNGRKEALREYQLAYGHFDELLKRYRNDKLEHTPKYAALIKLQESCGQEIDRLKASR